jgi:type IX secretion system PorP/SprF family membrane protein
MKIIKQIKVTAVVIAMLFCLTNVRAQYDAMFTQYMFNEMFINPAYAGSKEALAVNALHRQQWLSFDGRPVTTTFSMHGPVMGNKMGVGLSVLNEKIGVLNRNMIYGSYAYRIKTGTAGYLSLGLMAGAHIQSSNFSNLKNVTNTADVQLTQNSGNVIAPNFGTGLYYYNETFYVGLSIPRLVDDNVKFSNTGSGADKGVKIDTKKFHYYFTIGKVFNIADGLIMKPQLMVKAVQNAPIEFDPNINFLLKEKLWLGASLRSYSDISAIVGYQFSPQFVTSLSYDYPLTKIQKYSAGSLEIALGYVFKSGNKKIATPRYF